MMDVYGSRRLSKIRRGGVVKEILKFLSVPRGYTGHEEMKKDNQGATGSAGKWLCVPFG